jgi:hypothetical protein
MLKITHTVRVCRNRTYNVYGEFEGIPFRFSIGYAEITPGNHLHGILHDYKKHSLLRPPSYRLTRVMDKLFVIPEFMCYLTNNANNASYVFFQYGILSECVYYRVW